MSDPAVEFVRLALATGVVLLPGYLVSRAVGQRGISAALGWGVACLFVAWAVVFTVHGTILLAAVVLAVLGVVALVALSSRRRRHPPPQGAEPEIPAAPVGVAAIGLVLGIMLWRVAGVVTQDGLFHLARVRKLVDLGNLHLRTVDEFKDGGLHPGYAFPLWHGFLALVAKVSGLDPTVVVNHESSILAVLACAVAWELGFVVFGSKAAGFSVLTAQLALYCLSAGDGGSYTSLSLPATAARQLLVPAAIVLFFKVKQARDVPALAALAAVFGSLTLVHPTYAIFVLIPLGGYAVVRYSEWRVSAARLAAACIPTLGAVLWLKPIVDETISHNPNPHEQRVALDHYASDLKIWSLHHFRLDASILGRSGTVAVAALLLVPVAGFAARRRWGALVLGGSISVLALMLVPVLFEHFSDAVSLSQSRRAAGFLPFSIAFAGALAILARSWLLVPFALVAGIVFQEHWPGDFGYNLTHGGPAIATWIALIGGAAALALGLLPHRFEIKERHELAAVAAVLFILPILYHDRDHWSPRVPTDPSALSPALVRELRAVPARSVIIASLPTSYELLAAAPIYVVAAPISHVANTTANQPAVRAKAVNHWLATGDPAVPRKYGATWEVVDGNLKRIR